ncbi:class II fructose-bisphosphate aldolase [Chloroflexota bacterium]
MAHLSLKSVLYDAKVRRYGVPTLWGGSVEKVLGHIQAAELSRAPLCLCYNHGLCPELPIEIGIPLIVSAAELAKVPVATILDHGNDLEMVTRAIHSGVSSVMFDGSSFPFQENTKQTKEVTRIAHAVGVSVEAELGAVGGSAIETGGADDINSVMTDPMQAKEFAEQTGVDALAISFGNVHGSYRGEPELDLDRVRKISELVSIPLVMHGASGLRESDYEAIISSGISKLNYHTAMSKKAALNIRQKVESAGADFGYHSVMNWNIQFYQEETEHLLEVLGCTGKADGFEKQQDTWRD